MTGERMWCDLTSCNDRLSTRRSGMGGLSPNMRDASWALAGRLLAGVVFHGDLTGNVLCHNPGPDEPPFCGVSGFSVAMPGLCSVSVSAAVPNPHFFLLKCRSEFLSTMTSDHLGIKCISLHSFHQATQSVLHSTAASLLYC